MSRMDLEISIRTIKKDNRSRVPMGFHQLTRSYNRPRGFTLIELLATLAILAIIAVIAAPSLQSFVLNNRIRSQAAALTSSLAFARTEAITRSTRVVTCPRTDINDCDCSGDQEEWESGWQVFVDTDNDAICDSDDSLLEVHGPLDGSGTTLRGSDNVTSKVSFIYDGSAQPGTFVLCDQRGFGDHALAINVLATGRSRNLTATDSSQRSCTPSDITNADDEDRLREIARVKCEAKESGTFYADTGACNWWGQKGERFAVAMEDGEWRD